MNDTAFNDGTCCWCGKRFGWMGSMVDMPKCPKCGRRPTHEELQAVDAELQEAELRILERTRKEKL